MTWWQWALAIAGAWSAVSVVVAGLSGLVIRGWRRGQRRDRQVAETQVAARELNGDDARHRSTPEVRPEKPGTVPEGGRVFEIVGRERMQASP